MTVNQSLKKMSCTEKKFQSTERIDRSTNSQCDWVEFGEGKSFMIAREIAL